MEKLTLPLKRYQHAQQPKHNDRIKLGAMTGITDTTPCHNELSFDESYCPDVCDEMRRMPAEKSLEGLG